MGKSYRESSERNGKVKRTIGTEGFENEHDEGKFKDGDT